MVSDAVALAQELVRFPSPNPPGEEKACVEFVAAHLRDLGFAVETYEFAFGRPSIVALLPGSTDAKPLAFTGHLDVVPIGTAPWTYPPFDAVIANGILHGRGSCDMKSGIAAFIAAAARLRAEKVTFRRGLVFVITAGEETGCQGAFDLARRGVLGEAELLIVAEPTSNCPVIAHKGSLRVEVSAAGRTAHSSMPEEGDNAISKIVDWTATPVYSRSSPGTTATRSAPCTQFASATWSTCCMCSRRNRSAASPRRRRIWISFASGSSWPSKTTSNGARQKDRHEQGRNHYRGLGQRIR